MYNPTLFHCLKAAKKEKSNKLHIYAKNEAGVPNDVPAPPVEMGEQTVLQQILLGGVKNNFSPVDMVLEILSYIKRNLHTFNKPLVKTIDGEDYLNVKQLEQYLQHIQEQQQKPTPPSPLPTAPRPGQ